MVSYLITGKLETLLYPGPRLSVIMSHKIRNILDDKVLGSAMSQNCYHVVNQIAPLWAF
jgi:hypothetical protein